MNIAAPRERRTDSERPLVSVVTPSFNQARFLRDALDSVAAQTYPEVEHWVIDGGSTDGSREILESRRGVSWISEPDRGQSHAINRGFRRAHGQILGWLNSDDTYQPDAIELAVRALQSEPSKSLVYGDGQVMAENGSVVSRFREIEPFNLWRLLYHQDFILQPSTFFTRELFERAGGLDEGLDFGMDWDLWIRMAAITDVLYLPRILANSREYSSTKTSAGGWRRIRELARIAKRHTGSSWTPGVRLYALDTLRRQLMRRSPAIARPWLERVVVWQWRRLLRGLPVHADGWLAPRSWLVAPSSWRAVRIVLALVGPQTQDDQTIEFAVSDRQVTRRQVGDATELTLDLELPDLELPQLELPQAPKAAFTKIAFNSDQWVTEPGADGRRLAARCLSLAEGEAG